MSKVVESMWNDVDSICKGVESMWKVVESIWNDVESMEECMESMIEYMESMGECMDSIVEYMESIAEYMEQKHSTWNPHGMWGQGKVLRNLWKEIAIMNVNGTQNQDGSIREYMTDNLEVKG